MQGIGRSMSEPTIGEQASPGPSDEMSAADLAHLVVDSAAERQLAAESMPEFLFPEAMLPGAGEEQTTLREGLRSTGARAFVVLAVIVTLDNLQTSGLAVLSPNIQSSFHVSTGAITFVAGITGGFLVLGILPMGWLADRYRRPPIIGWATLVFGLMVAATGLRHQHLRVLPGPSRRRHLAVEHPKRPWFVVGRHLSDQRPRPALRRHGHVPGPGSCRQPAAGGSHRDRGGRSKRLALGLLHPGRPRPAGRGLRLPYSRAAPWAVREEGRARRRARRYASRRTVFRGRVRAGHAHPHDQDRAHRLLGHRLRALHRPRAWQPLSQAALRARCLPARHRRHHRQRRGADRAAPRRPVLRPPLPEGSGKGPVAHRQGRPARRPHRPHSVLHAQCGALGGLQRAQRRPPPDRVLHDRLQC